MLDPLFREMKLNRLKVNEDKTGLLLMGRAPARRRLLEGGGSRTLKLAGEVIQPAPKAKSLGLIILEDMNWTDEVDIGKMQPQTEVNDEAKRSGYNGPKEGISRGGDIKQAEPALRGDKHGKKIGSGKTAANAK